MQEGLVVRSTGSWYEVLMSEGQLLKCRTVGKLRLNTLKVTNPVAVGDKVMIEMEQSEETGLIKEIMDRDNYIIRQSPRKKHYLHILAANIDQAVLIVTIKSPKLKQGFIDRFILMTEPFDIPVHIFFNKGDLYGDDELMTFAYLKEIYERIGYNCHLISAKEEKGFKNLKAVTQGKLTLFSGQSGVGKSSVLNVLAPDLQLKVGAISDYMGKGQHTTTFAEMHVLDDDTKIIDTPGIKTLSFNYLEVQDVAHNFREFFEVSPGCKFPDCTHRNEPKCAVKQGLESGLLSELRYNNYLKIIEEVEEQNYWERK